MSRNVSNVWWVCLWLFVVAPLVRGASPSAPDRSFDELAEQLEDADPELRRTAVRGLARHGGARAWELVFSALLDREGQVADAAQLALGQLSDPELVEELGGRRYLGAKEESVRRRVAEALGRVPVPVPVKVLASGLADRSTAVRRRTLWSVERLGRAGIAGDVERKLVPGIERRWRSDRDGEVRAGALLALAALDVREVLELAEDGLDDRREPVRLAALRVLGRDPDRATELQRALVRDGSARVRSQLIEALEGAGTRDAAKGIVVQLEAEERPRLRWGAVDALRRLSGLKYRLDPRPWRLWAERLAADGRPARASIEALPAGATRAFGGMPVLSDRVAFLFDLSGSVWRKRDDGSTRKELAEAELARALRALPADARFNVVPYTDRPFPFEDAVVAATERNVQRALEFFAACRETGRGNFYDAARLALEDPDIDTIMVLTDGAPTGGEVWSLDLIVPLLLEENRFRKVRFDTVLVDAPPGIERHWEALAAGSGGRCRALDVP